ncbi:MAG: ABC transporter ATP-binding protein [Saprospiraceae bacterium]
MLEIRNLYKNFGNNEVLQGINVSFEEAGIFAVLGPNSSGKTTLIKSILGIVIPQKGEILINEENVIGKWEYRNRIGYLPQIARFPENLKVNELLRLIKDIRGSKTSEQELIELFELAPFLNKRLGNLSGGTRQKVNIVQAFMYDNPIVFLDEPTAGLDPVSLIRFKEMLYDKKRDGKLILITTHIMSLVEEMADELVFLLEGKIHYRGQPSDMKKSYGAKDLERAIANMLRGEFKIEPNGHTQIDSKTHLTD